MRSLLILAFVAFTTHSYAQTGPVIPFAFTSEEDNRYIKENDSVKFYVATGDTSYIVSLNEEGSYYKLLTKDKKVIAEGSFIAEGDKYLQDGKWTEHYDNGKTKLSGYYRRNSPIGTWLEYYSTGKIKTVYNYGIFSSSKGEISSCLSGTYQEYYPSGKLKVNGFYMAATGSKMDTVVVTDPATGTETSKVIKHTSLTAEKANHWEYYSEEGELDKKEDF